MDPNAALANLRTMVKEALDDPAAEVSLVELAEQFNALDHWIEKGGFLPDDWKPVTV